ncbi:hypothetical protein A2188_01710 [Candidatus Woesebacteria bacterium RIFOXYA1_FULL_43_9]|uniref:Uncharacterized protein n=1 Tax=Candidatus Woesebacteria bacterium RIFOXYA1_FULL_43_9 TaxID=1802534 RepID=A0A1F8CPW7_9BACT|nr:MAG: hypothetical protein A2188_01710 [Candidatus Woesebacteria bacterium RIFOXYA1_FULL_43_9]
MEMEGQPGFGFIGQLFKKWRDFLTNPVDPGRKAFLEKSVQVAGAVALSSVISHIEQRQDGGNIPTIETNPNEVKDFETYASLCEAYRELGVENVPVDSIPKENTDLPETFLVGAAFTGLDKIIDHMREVNWKEECGENPNITKGVHGQDAIKALLNFSQNKVKILGVVQRILDDGTLISNLFYILDGDSQAVVIVNNPQTTSGPGGTTFLTNRPNALNKPKYTPVSSENLNQVTNQTREWLGQAVPNNGSCDSEKEKIPVTVPEKVPERNSDQQPVKISTPELSFSPGWTTALAALTTLLVAAGIKKAKSSNEQTFAS